MFLTHKTIDIKDRIVFTFQLKYKVSFLIKIST